MTRLTEPQLKRRLSAIREVDPGAIVEVTQDGTIRIIPGAAVPQQPVDQFDMIDMRSR